jgi:hypothetical protein
VAALERAQQLHSEWGVDHLLRAMAHWQLGEKGVARNHLDLGILLLEKQSNMDKTVRRHLDEAAVLLGIAKEAQSRKPGPQ